MPAKAVPYLTPDAAAGVTLCRRLRFPSELADILTGALERLTHEWVFEAFGSMTPTEAANHFAEMFNGYLDSGDICDMGGIVDFVIDPGAGWLLCDGTTYLREDYPELYARLTVETSPLIIDADNFSVPDLRGKFRLGSDAGDLATGGAATVTLTEAQIPAHTHTYDQIGATLTDPGEVPSAIGIDDINTVNTGTTGGSEAHENMPPYTAFRPYLRARP